jgi:serine O-acetyltransferase
VSAALQRVERRGTTLSPAWELSRVVRELRLARASGPSPLHHGRAGDLPSRETLVGVVEGLRAALFPAHFGCRDLSEESVDYFVGHTLDAALGRLFEQVRRELSLRHDASEQDSQERAYLLTRTFSAELPRIRTLLESDVQAALHGDPAATSVDEVIFCYPGITAVTHHRIAHALYTFGVPLLARIISELAHCETGIDIHPGARIAESFFIDHGTGVVIGETSVIGARVRLYQGVTLGAKSFPVDERGAAIKSIPRHPILEDDVVVYAGATVLGRITIGRGATVGGNVWITHDVAPGSRVTQHQPSWESFGGGAGI